MPRKLAPQDYTPQFDPYVIELSGEVDSVRVFQRLSHRRHCVFLDSAKRHPSLGRYSFLAADPFEVMVARDGQRGLATVGRRLKELRANTVAGLPPFQGGVAGLWSYDLGKSLERIPKSRFDEFQLPWLAVGFYDVVVAFDHQQKRAWIISQGFPETNPISRATRARRRAEQFSEWLEAPAVPGPNPIIHSEKLNLAELSPCFPCERPGVSSNFTAEAYKRTIQRVIDYIRAGDVFQVNLAQRLLHDATTDPISLYLRLRHCNAAPFAGFLDLGQHQIISASPERFLNVQAGDVEARPIKGTRQRTTRPEADLFSAAELLASGKDLAENVMIVDLMRNDLSRVCEDDSVRVTQLCGLETYEYVQHLVSVVRGRLRKEVSPIDLIAASFPGGSITGAPKVRAMEIIAELEPAARGAYCGSLGYVGFDGAMDLSILIRTITASRGWWQFPVGGGIVAQSDPDMEYHETWVKAQGMLQAVRECRPSSLLQESP